MKTTPYKNKKPSTECSSGYLTMDEIENFQDITYSTLHKKLTKSEAEDQGTRLIMLFEQLQESSLDKEGQHE